MPTQSAENEEARWKQAEHLARKYREAMGDKIASVERLKPLPYFVRIGFETEYGSVYVLVWDGKVIDQTGTPVLIEYLRASRFLTRRDVDTELFHDLMSTLRADPPAGRNVGYYSDTSTRPEWCPHLIWDADGGARFVLHYVVGSTPPFGGSRANADEIEVEEWTLRIPPSYDIVWTKHTFTAHR